MSDVAALKEAARAEIERRRADLVDLSHLVHANPEVGFREEQAAAWVAEALADAGFDVERGVAGLPTAFEARLGAGPLHVGIFAEYDALPGLGHACGHNVIAAAAVGAAQGLASAAAAAGLTIRVFGTPAEEGGGGKVLMLRAGVFDGLHAAMMVHPGPADALHGDWLAISHIVVRYTGKEAHAAAAPEQGVNAADALTVAQVAIGLLRQHIRASDRVHGIVTSGGDAPNVVPAHTAGEFIVRSRTKPELESLLPRVLACFEAGATATGATLEVEELSAYAHMEQDEEILAAFARNAAALGRPYPPPGEEATRFTASTDFGDVSLAVPGIHPLIGVEAGGASNHQPAFAVACATESADRAVFDGAVLMAWTAIDLATDAGLRTRLLERPGA